MILRAFSSITITCIQFEAISLEVNPVLVPPNIDLLLEQVAQYLTKLNVAGGTSPVFSYTSLKVPSLH